MQNKAPINPNFQFRLHTVPPVSLNSFELINFHKKLSISFGNRVLWHCQQQCYFRGEAALRSWDSHLLLQIACFPDRYSIKNNIWCEHACLEHAYYLEHPPNPYFWHRNHHGICLNFHLSRRSSMCSPGNPLKKLGKVAEAQPKSSTGYQRTFQIANFKRPVLHAQTELSAQILGANQVGVKVLVFGICCMLPVHVILV